MTWTVVAPLVTRDGSNLQGRFSHDPAHFWNPIQHKVWAIPSCEVRSVQAPEIPLRLAHGEPPAGRIVHLERRSSDGSLWCVGEFDEDVGLLPNRDYYLSVEATFNEGTIGSDVEITGAALCAKSAMIGLWPATFLRSGLDHRGRASWRTLGTFQTSLLEHADAARRHRRAGDPITVHDEAPVVAEVLPMGITLDLPPVIGALEYRSARPAGVTGRTVHLIVMPYESPTVVAHRGRMVTEVVSRGAFDGIERRTGRVTVNRDHDIQRTVGRATSFDPHDPRGLVAELRISRTTLGDETLALAEDGVLDASAGFGVLPGGETWEHGRSRRRLTKLHLDHVALTPCPAYEDARVLAVRTSRTPNLDRVLASR